VATTITADVNVGSLAFSADGKSLHGLCQDLKVRTWAVASGTLQNTLAFDKDDSPATLNATTAVSVAKDGTLKTWDLASGKVAKRVTPPGPRSRRTAPSPTDGRFFIAHGETEIKMRAIDQMGKEEYVVPAGLGGIASMAVSPDGANVVAASYDADVRAWNSRNGELLRMIDELPVSMFDMKFSPDGKWLAAAGADKTLYFYDTKTWRQTKTIPKFPEMISALAISPDGTRIATGGFNEITLKMPVKVHVLDVKSGAKLHVLDAKQRVSSVTFSPDGKSLAVSTGTKSVEIWQVG
jgi:WD40 repeat protein